MYQHNMSHWPESLSMCLCHRRGRPCWSGYWTAERNQHHLALSASEDLGPPGTYQQRSELLHWIWTKKKIRADTKHPLRFVIWPSQIPTWRLVRSTPPWWSWITSSRTKLRSSASNLKRRLAPPPPPLWIPHCVSQVILNKIRMWMHFLKDNINFVRVINSLSTFIRRVSFWCLSLQKSSLMFKRLDASTLPEDILSETQTLPMMAHSAGSALWVFALLHVCLLCLLFHSPLLMYSFSLPSYRTRGGFVALSPISPQELFLQPMSSDVEASQPENPVSVSKQPPLSFISDCCSDLLSFSWTDTTCTNIDKQCKLCMSCGILKGPLRFNILMFEVYIHQLTRFV